MAQEQKCAETKSITNSQNGGDLALMRNDNKIPITVLLDPSVVGALETLTEEVCKGAHGGRMLISRALLTDGVALIRGLRGRNPQAVETALRSLCTKIDGMNHITVTVEEPL